jgi:hypothetical protein
VENLPPPPAPTYPPTPRGAWRGAWCIRHCAHHVRIAPSASASPAGVLASAEEHAGRTHAGGGGAHFGS